MTPLVAGNKLVIPVTLVICEIAHTDVGEAFLTSFSRKGEPREEENAATEAYSQAFRRACAQVGLGRYLYGLPKVWVPYDPQKRAIALSEQELRLLAERLYRKAGLLPASPAAASKATITSSVGPVPVPPASAQELTGAPAAPTLPLAPMQEPAAHMDEERLPASSPAPLVPTVGDASNGNLYEASAVISPYQRSWIERQVGGNPSRIAKVCQFYQVGTLDELSGLQTVDLVNRLFTQQAEERQRRAPARGARPGQQKASKAVAR